MFFIASGNENKMVFHVQYSMCVFLSSSGKSNGCENNYILKFAVNNIMDHKELRSYFVCYRRANLQCLDSHQYGSSLERFWIYCRTKKNTRLLIVNKSHKNGCCEMFSSRFLVKYSNGRLVIDDVLIMLNVTNFLRNLKDGRIVCRQIHHINLVMLISVAIEINFVQVKRNHSVYSDLKEKISESQDGKRLKIWCDDVTVYVNNCLDIYLHKLWIQSETNGCQWTYFRIDGRRNARTFHYIVWLVESIRRDFWFDVSSDWIKIHFGLSEPKKIHTVLCEFKKMVVHHGNVLIQLRTADGGHQNICGNLKFCFGMFLDRHDTYYIERDGDDDRIINEIEVGNVSMDDLINSFIQWFRIVSTLTMVCELICIHNVVLSRRTFLLEAFWMMQGISY